MIIINEPSEERLVRLPHKSSPLFYPVILAAPIAHGFTEKPFLPNFSGNTGNLTSHLIINMKRLGSRK